MGYINRSTHHIIRLTLKGCTNRPFYLITVQKNRVPRGQKVWDQIGTFDPMPNIYNEKLVAIDFDRLRYWLAKGALTSKPVAQLLGLAGYFPVHPSMKIKAYKLNKKQEEEQRLQLEAKQQHQGGEDQPSTS